MASGGVNFNFKLQQLHFRRSVPEPTHTDCCVDENENSCYPCTKSNRCCRDIVNIQGLESIVSINLSRVVHPKLRKHSQIMTIRVSDWGLPMFVLLLGQTRSNCKFLVRIVFSNKTLQTKWSLVFLIWPFGLKLPVQENYEDAVNFGCYKT
jgi:hypothetical protein